MLGFSYHGCYIYNVKINNKDMLKLKDGVTGFVYDSMYGIIIEICTEYVDVENIVLNDDDYVFVYNENVNNLFEISSKEELEYDEEGLSEVLEWVN
jgi:hypothetical protein